MASELSQFQACDYVKANLDKVDNLAVTDLGVCLRIAYSNVRNSAGHDLTVLFWQIHKEHFHAGSLSKRCEFNVSQGQVFSEDNFGKYKNVNKAFRCTRSDEGTVSHCSRKRR